MFSWSQFCVILLMMIAFWVALRQWRNAKDKGMACTWVLIALYWAVLTAKNLCDLMGW